MSNNIQEKVVASCTSSPRKAFLDGVASAPVTTTTGRHPASSATDAARLSIVSPPNRSSCFGLPIRVEAPAARTTAPMPAGSVTRTVRSEDSGTIGILFFFTVSSRLMHSNFNQDALSLQRGNKHHLAGGTAKSRGCAVAAEPQHNDLKI